MTQVHSYGKYNTRMRLYRNTGKELLLMLFDEEDGQQENESSNKKKIPSVH